MCEAVERKKSIRNVTGCKTDPLFSSPYLDSVILDGMTFFIHPIFPSRRKILAAGFDGGKA